MGENEAGKSTILEAIRIVLNQLYWNADKSVLQDLFNLENVRAFQNNPNVATLPRIMIEVDLELDNTPRFIDFYGENHVNGNRSEEKYGIRFECKFDEDFSEELADSINDGKIPYEYYSLTWQTYANLPYKIDDANEFNQHNEKQHVFMGATMEDWTWEACVYNCNKEKLDTMIQVQDGAEYLFHRTNYGQVLGKMLNNKVDTA